LSDRKSWEEFLARSDKPEAKAVLQRMARISELEDLDASMRGKYLTHVIALELMVDRIFSTHLKVPYDVRKKFEPVPRRTWFETKIDKLKDLLKSEYPKIVMQYPTLITRLHTVRKNRNKMAHWAPDIDDESIMKLPSDRIRLVYYDNKGIRKSITITQKSLRLQIKEIEELMAILLDVDRIISEKANTRGISMNYTLSEAEIDSLFNEDSVSGSAK
jgi:hypothetical protein